MNDYFEPVQFLKLTIIFKAVDILHLRITSSNRCKPAGSRLAI